MRKLPLMLLLILMLLIAVIIGGVVTISSLFTHTLSDNSNPSLYLTGTKVIPTVAVPASTTECDPQHLPTPDGPATPGEGTIPPAIQPHLCSIPTFTKQDVQHYMSSLSRFQGMRIEQVSPQFTVTRILFVTNKVANDILNADTGVIDDTLVVCYVEVYGDFAVASPFVGSNSKHATLHHGQMVFDGVTGRLLVIGVLP